MFWLGLLLAICYVPGYTGASIPTQWAVLSIVLPLSLWRVSSLTLGHKLFLAFAFYAALSALWSINLYSWVWGMWLVFIWGLCLHLGTLYDDLSKLWRGLAVGLSLSVVVAVAQGLDFAPVETNDPYRASGLFFNSSLFGVILGLVLVALVCHRLWWYMPPLALGLILSASRGGLAVLAIGLIARFSPLLALASIVAGALAFTFGVDLADNQRLTIWGTTLHNLTWLGQGAGSFTDVHYILRSKNLLIRPEFVHNDILQLIYEYGIGTVAFIAIPALASFRASPNRPVLLAFCVLALFYFPLYAPLTAFIGLVVAGHCLRIRAMDGTVSNHRRSDLIPWHQKQRALSDLPWSEAIPMVARTAR